MTATPLAERVVILTGAAGLLGRSYATALVDAGARVALADVRGGAVKDLAASFDTRVAVPIEADVSDPQSVYAMVARTREVFGRVDVLVNNAALDPKFDRATAGDHAVTFETFPLEAWQAAITVNLTGMFLCCQAVAPVMLAQGRGVIINIGSIYGMVGPDQRLYETAGAGPVFKPVTYSVTKSAVYGLTRYLAAYWARKNLRVNALTLGGVEHEQEPAFVQRYGEGVPLGRMARPDEYCGALVFLASDASSYMTGANLVVDGGWTAW
jgi:NAD(P)-dependent dehydrogenase (short-subunit alcohol dehydrogenase family)